MFGLFWFSYLNKAENEYDLMMSITGLFAWKNEHPERPGGLYKVGF